MLHVRKPEEPSVDDTSAPPSADIDNSNGDAKNPKPATDTVAKDIKNKIFNSAEYSLDESKYNKSKQTANTNKIKTKPNVSFKIKSINSDMPSYPWNILFLMIISFSFSLF